jgi:hypothetical protein
MEQGAWELDFKRTALKKNWDSKNGKQMLRPAAAVPETVSRHDWMESLILNTFNTNLYSTFTVTYYNTFNTDLYNTHNTIFITHSLYSL